MKEEKEFCISKIWNVALNNRILKRPNEKIKQEKNYYQTNKRFEQKKQTSKQSQIEISMLSGCICCHIANRMMREAFPCVEDG